jgi:addiction module HigA family antidote
MGKKKILVPGDVIKSLMAEFQISASQLARDIHLSAPCVNSFIYSRTKIGVNAACRLAKYFGTTPKYWLDLQADYDLFLAKEDPKFQKELDNIPKVSKPKKGKEAPEKKAPAKKQGAPVKKAADKGKKAPAAGKKVSAKAEKTAPKKAPSSASSKAKPSKAEKTAPKKTVSRAKASAVPARAKAVKAEKAAPKKQDAKPQRKERAKGKSKKTEAPAAISPDPAPEKKKPSVILIKKPKPPVADVENGEDGKVNEAFPEIIQDTVAAPVEEVTEIAKDAFFHSNDDDNGVAQDAPIESSKEPEELPALDPELGLDGE